MIDSGQQENATDRIMRQVRAEVARQKALMQRAREQVPRATAAGSAAPLSGAVAVALPRFPEALAIQAKPAYALADFLAFHDEDFVRNAYRAILRREPDEGGFAAFLDALRSGRLAKVEIVGRLRYSGEGRRAGVPIRGLTLPFAARSARRVPVLGRIVGIAQYVIRLPDIVRNHERLEATLFQRELETRRQVNAGWALVEQALARLQRGTEQAVREGEALAARLAERDRSGALVDARLANAESSIAGKVDRAVVEQRAKRIEDDLAAIRAAIDAVDARKADVAGLHAVEAAGQAALATLHAALDGRLDSKVGREELEQVVRERIALFARSIIEGFEASKADRGAVDRLAAELDATRSAMAREIDTRAALDGMRRELLVNRNTLLDQQYRVAALLDRMKSASPAIAAPARVADHELERMLDGFFAEFEERFRGPSEEIRARAAIYLDDLRAAGAGTIDAPVLDLGCGRGDWLELLRDEGRIATGVDVNRISVHACRQRGLDVVEADAVDYLRAQPEASFGAISALHVVEHLGFEQLLRLLDEARRALKPNGLLVLETPNPENLIVGACNFWFDPTHVRPLPPPLLQFVVESRGFAAVEVRRLHPYPEDPAFAGMAPGMQAVFRGPQDYAVIARRA